MSQSFSLKTQLKSSFVNYLQNLCHGNRIDIQLLKTHGHERESLEMFFGGFPVLVGLKYFSNLSTLRLFGQQISCLKPLAEICGSLIELWICEGQLKALSGIGCCKNLKKLYLYQNQIENANEISELENLELLYIQHNQLNNLKFLEKLTNLHNLNLGSNDISEKELGTVNNWPISLRFINLSGNRFNSFQNLFPLSACTSICNISFNGPYDNHSNITYNNEIYGWLSYHFRFLETLDEDEILDAFFITYATKAHIQVAVTLAKIAKIEEIFYKDINMAEKFGVRAANKLSKICEALNKVTQTISMKDVKRDVLNHVSDMFRTSLSIIKKIKQNYKRILKFQFQIYRYRLSINVESAHSNLIHEATDEDIDLIKHFLNFHCSAKQQYEIIVRACLLRKTLVKGDSMKFSLLEKSTENRMFSDHEACYFFDHFHKIPRTEARLFLDFDMIFKEAAENESCFTFPIVQSKQPRNYNKNDPTTIKQTGLIDWHELELVAVVMVEVVKQRELNTDHIKSKEKFDEALDIEIKKLKDLHITLDLKEDTSTTTKSISNPKYNDDSTEVKTTQLITVKDVANIETLRNRWSDFCRINSRLTLRNPLEIALAYNIPEVSYTDFYMNITSLDLSNLRLNKLAGIELIPNLINLSLKNNRLISVKKLKELDKLLFLDISCNKIVKTDHLPSNINHLILSENHITSLQFCNNLKNLIILDISRNEIKSLKGLEQCSNLQTLIAHTNQLKDKVDIENIKNCSKLSYIDLYNNKLTSSDGYRSKMLLHFPQLAALDREIIPVEDRIVSFNKTGRGLSIEVIHKNYPDLDNLTSISLSGNNLEIFVLDESCLNKIMHITELDLSNNQFENVKKLGVLQHLKKLNVSQNHIRLLWSQSKPDELDDFIPFKSLEHLNLCGNEISNGIMSLIGLQYLQKLKTLNLNDNVLTTLDSMLFDLPYLEKLTLQRNLIRLIKRKCLNQLVELDLSFNRLKDLNGLTTPNLEDLNVSQNCITTCAALKPIAEMNGLKRFDCTGNPVASHRVYIEFIRSKAPHIEILDTKSIVDVPTPIIKRRASMVQLELENKEKRDLSSSPISFSEWEETLVVPVPQKCDFSKPKPSPNLLFVNGIKMTKHRKSYRTE